MPDKELVEAVLEAVGIREKEHVEEHKKEHCEEHECAVPKKIVYIIFCNCTTINNGACEDWEFCEECHRR